MLGNRVYREAAVHFFLRGRCYCHMLAETVARRASKTMVLIQGIAAWGAVGKGSFAPVCVFSPRAAHPPYARWTNLEKTLFK